MSSCLVPPTKLKYTCSYLLSKGYCVEGAPVVANGLVPEHPLLPDLEQEPSVQIRHLAANTKGALLSIGDREEYVRVRWEIITLVRHLRKLKP